MKIPHVFITGDMTMPEKKEAMDEFRKNDAVRVVITNRKAAGIGINLVEASYSIVFSRNFSLEDELQSEARNYRGGSQIHKSITKIDLVTKNTIDEVVLAALQSKKNISDAVIDFAMENVK
jgi:SNF2 family DNA or RNA helicase